MQGRTSRLTKTTNCGTDKSCSSAGIGYKPENSDDEIQNFSLNMNWEVGNGTLTSVTGWAGYEYFDDVDVDWLPLQFIDRSDIHDFEQLARKFAGPLTSGIVFPTR